MQGPPSRGGWSLRPHMAELLGLGLQGAVDAEPLSESFRAPETAR